MKVTRLPDSYLARREAQERAAAAGSGDPGAKLAHLDLARRYAALQRPAGLTR